jgi:hypothetical protein
MRVRAAAASHRIPGRLADHVRQPDLPGPARLGPGEAGDLRGRLAPRAATEPTEWITGRPATTAVDPADRVTLDDSINMAFLVVLEAMTRPNASRSSCTTSSATRSPTSQTSSARTPPACRQLASRPAAASAPDCPSLRGHRPPPPRPPSRPARQTPAMDNRLTRARLLSNPLPAANARSS